MADLVTLLGIVGRIMKSALVLVAAALLAISAAVRKEAARLRFFFTGDRGRRRFNAI